MLATYRKIKLNKNDCVELHGDAHVNSVVNLKSGKFESQSPATDELKAALNAFMQTCYDVGQLGDVWMDDLGAKSWVSGVTFVPDDNGMGLVVTAQYRHDYGEGTKAIVFNTPCIKSAELTMAEVSAIEALQKEILAYVNGLPGQGTIPGLDADDDYQKRAEKDFKDVVMPVVEEKV